MKFIPLTKGKFTIVDDKNYEWLNQWKWQIDSDGYAVRSVSIKEEYKGNKKRMHRVIMNTPEGMETDHINGNRLDNRRQNLRICTRAENVRNCKKHRDNHSGYKGVYWNKREKKWRASIRIGKQDIHLGYFKSTIEAARAYNKKAKKLFGKFARINKT